MKFACTQLSLIKALSTVNKAVSTRTTIPVLKGILLNIKDNRLYLTASDLDLSIETSIDVQAESEGSLVVNAKLFEDIIRKLPSAIVKIEEVGGKLLISCLGSEFSIVTLPAEEFPSIGMVNELNKVVISKDIFKELIKRTSFAASLDEKKGSLTGCSITFNNNVLEIAALDGFRLAVAKENFNGPDRKVIIPAKILNEINKILSENESNEISLILDEKKAEIFIDETRVIVRLLEGEFIKYKDIIPSEYKTRVIVSVAEIQSAIERASLFAKEGKNNLIKLEIKDGNIEITSRSEEGNVKENVSAEIEGEDLTIGFNSKYLIDVFKVVNDDEVAIEMGSAVSACLIKPISGDNYLYLVLPVRISAN
ncbi:MAG: DNA polymerase III subunit beta [Bacillota bacterium]|nr:DNA polymerase III subunit beta [Bacillota bacterium]